MEASIRLADGKTYEVHYCGVNIIDASLGIQFTGTNEGAVRLVFSDPAALSRIVYTDCGEETVYDGYTRLGRVNEARPGLVIASLYRQGGAT